MAKLPKVEVLEDGYGYSVGVKVNGRKRKASQTGSSHTRDIYFIGKNLVLKTGDESQNLTEARVWGKIEKKDRKYFAEVLHCSPGGEFLIQRRVKFTRPGCDADDHDGPAGEKVRELAAKYDFSDMHDDNWGIQKNGDPIIFDLGY